MGTVTAIEECNQIRRELAEYDLAHSRDPIDRRRAEKQAEARAQEAQTAREQKNTQSWVAWIDQRIEQHLRRYFGSGDENAPGLLTTAIGQVMGENRMLARKELKQAIEDEEKWLATKLVELEERWKSAAATFPIVKSAWQPETVSYRGELISHRGSLYQARKDTAQEPGRGADWACVARRGRDAITPTVRGSYDAHECYGQLGVDEFDGACDFQSDVLGAVVAKLGMELRSEFKCAIEQRSLVAKEDFDRNIEIFEAKVKAAIATCERAAAEIRSSIPAMIDEAVAKHVTQAMANIQRSLVVKDDFDKNTDVFEAKVKAAIATCERAASEIRSSIPSMVDEAVGKHVTQAMVNIRQPADGAKGEKGDPGCLPMVQSYIPGKIYYRGDAVADSTGTYQAKCDTARAPSPESEDWTCVARAGRDGRTPTIRSTFDVHESYAELDIITFDGAAFIARRDNPGLPGHGDGWQVLSQRGKQGLQGESVTGPRGEKGMKGDKGDDALQIVSWHIDAPNYRAVPFMRNGQPGPELDLRALFLQFLQEVGNIEYAWG